LFLISIRVAMPKETNVDVMDTMPGSSLQSVAVDQIDYVSTKHVQESDDLHVLVVACNPDSSPNGQSDAEVHLQSSHSTKDTFNSLPNGQPLKGHSINGTPSGHSIKNFHRNGFKGGDAVLNFKIALPSASAELAAATPCCAALAIVLASHTNLPDFSFTTVTGGEQSLKYPGENPSSEDSTPEPPFGINVDWKSDLQHLLQNVQGRIDPTTTRIHHLSHALPLFFEPRTHHLKDESNSSYSRVMVECSLHAGEVDISFQFDPTVINPKAIQHVSRQYDYVLQEICAAASESGRLISEFRVADMRDLRDLWRWNSKVPERVDELVHDIFARVVKAQPDSPAICAHDGELTYRELDRLSTHLAHCLVAYGVRDTIVPVHIEKSMWTPVVQLGIMKAGAASVVLDASQPEERLRTIVKQVHPRVVLTSVENEAVTRCLSTKPVMVVGETALAQRAPSIAQSELPEVVPSERLYIVFTSGSTGMPKGATVTHSNFASAIRHQQKALQFRAGQRVFDFASYAFDVAWSNFLHTITAGGCLCIPSDEERKQDIPAALQKYKAEYAHLTPSVAWFSPDDLPDSVEIMHFSGEELKASLVEGFRDKVTIINTYGPAECSVTSTMQLVDTDVVDTNPPIGHGLGSCPWVVSLSGAQLVPIGAIGELWIEGPIVGGGYLNDQQKTNAAFIEDPLWLLGGDFTADQPGRRGRLYRTGDLVRQNRHDGSLSFVGRKDSQVKIRGQRLELGEVEHHLRSTLPSELQKSLEVIVEVVIPHGSKNPALVACVSPLNDTPDSEVETLVHEATAVWDQKLIDLIPSYMIPSACIPCDTFPMTATGKTDRRRLREMAALSFWEHAAPEDGAERTLPTSESEEKMLQVWSEVLNIPADKISTDAPFTRLGGDSITAMQVVSRCRAREIVVTVADLLKLRTIRALVAHSKTSGPAIAAVASDDDAEGRSWALSPMQQLFFDAHPEGLDHYTQSFLLRITRHVTLQALREALNTVVQRHGMLRSRFRRNMDSQAWEQVIVPTSEDAFLVEEHSDYAGSALEQIVQSRQASLSQQNGPVFAADLFDGRPGEDPSLLLSAHHTIIDLVSWRVIWHELEECLTRGAASLPPPPVSFQTWCRLQREEGQELDPDTVLPYTVEAAQLEYWGLEQGDNCFADSDMHESIIDAESTALLLGRSNHTLRTETLDILVGALVHSFRQAFTDRSAPAVFLEGHGREPVEGTGVDLAETVGWFTTLHPVPVSGSRTDTLVDAIRYAKDTRASVPDKGRPYIACRYHNAAGREAFTDHRSVELLLNYRGIFQQLENTKALLQREDRPDRAVAIPEFGDDYQRMALVEINIVVESGRARISTTTHKRMRHRERLDLWIGSLFPDALRAASQDLLAAPSAHTLADFPLLSISYPGLDALLTGQLAAYGVATAAIQDIYPCTPVQEGILLSEKKGAASYRNNWVWRCSSRSESGSGVSPERLIAAWKDVVRRHTVFSTIFASHPETGRSLQVLLDNNVPSVARVKPVAGKSSMQHLLDMNAPTTGSSYTVTVCQDSAGEVSCRLDMSHALIDASSIPVLLRDVALVYAERGWGDRPYPPPFSNVVGHIHRSLSSPSRLDYWQKHLAGAEKCEILGDLLPLHARRTDGNARYGLIPLTATTSAISGYCREHNITRAVFLEVAWALVLAHFTGMTEVCFGYVCSGRDTPVDRVEAIVGPLISMLVARIDLSAHLKNVLLAVGEKSIEHLSHQHASLAEIHHSVGASGPLFNTAITVREAHQYGSEDGLRLEEMREEDPHEVSYTPFFVHITIVAHYLSSRHGLVIDGALWIPVNYLIVQLLIQMMHSV
jgi:amino acid adenylation domain-containing protein